MLRRFNRPKTLSVNCNGLKADFRVAYNLIQSCCYETSPKIVSAFSTRVYYPFLYDGRIRDSQTFKVFKNQIKLEHYKKIQFEEHLFCSKVLSVSFNNPYTRESEYWKLASQGFKLNFPLHFEISSKTEKNEKAKPTHNIYVHLSTASVNFFTNNIGLLEMKFEWDGEGASCELDTKPSNKAIDDIFIHSEQNSTMLQSVLDLQRLFLDGTAPLKLVSPKFNEKKQLKNLINIKIPELVESIIDEHIILHDFVTSWKPIANFQSYFVFSQVLTNQISFNKYSVWDYNQLALWTYLLASASPSEFSTVKSDFLQNFLEKDCYLRWSSESGGLWIGFATHGGGVIQFPTSYEEAEKLQLFVKQQEKKDVVAQLIYPLLFQKIYLQVEINRIRHLISQSTSDNFTFQSNKEFLIHNFKSIEGKLLRFNLIFCDAISSSSSATAMFEIWQSKLSITKLKSSLVNHVAEVAGYYSGLINESQQAKLTLLTVVVSALGFSQILIEIISSSNMPLAASFLLYSVGMALIAYQKLLIPKAATVASIKLLVSFILILAIASSTFGLFGKSGLLKFAGTFASNLITKGKDRSKTEEETPEEEESESSNNSVPTLPVIVSSPEEIEVSTTTRSVENS